MAKQTRNSKTRKGRVPLRSWIATPPFELCSHDRRDFQSQMTDVQSGLGGLRRSCEVLRLHATSYRDYLIAIRIHELLAEASHLATASGGTGELDRQECRNDSQRMLPRLIKYAVDISRRMKRGFEFS